MTLHRKTLLLFFFICTGFYAYSQKGYVIINDSTRFENVRIIENGSVLNALECEFEFGKEILGYGPKEVKEYGVYGKTAYVSKNLSIHGIDTIFFFELIAEGELSLYYLHSGFYKGFFIEQDNSLIMLKRMNSARRKFNQILLMYPRECFDVGNIAGQVKYNRYSLSKYVEWYNNCEERPFPASRYGISFGYGSGAQELDFGFDYFMFDIQEVYEPRLYLRALIDVPMTTNAVRFHSELNFSRSEVTHSTDYFDHITGKHTYLDYAGTSNAVSIPLMLKGVFAAGKTESYIEAGYQGALRFLNNHKLYHTTITENVVRLEEVVYDDFFPRFSHGIECGAGIGFVLDNKYLLDVGVRYSKLRNNTLINQRNAHALSFHTSLYFF